MNFGLANSVSSFEHDDKVLDEKSANDQKLVVVALLRVYVYNVGHMF